MRNIPTIARRELSAYFFSSIAYVVGGVFLATAGFFFRYGPIEFMNASLRNTLGVVGFMMMFMAPALTMRLLAEEKRSGTIETLMTAPVTDWEVVLGKYFACLGFYLLMLLPTLFYLVILKKLGAPDYREALVGYLGLVLLGSLFISFGMIASALTRNQIVAALLSFVPLFLFSIIPWVVPEPDRYMGATSAAGHLKEAVFAALRYMGWWEHETGFIKGLVDTRDVVYFVSLTVFFIFLTVRITESRKWK